ncbi:MAG: hypothetical protein LBM08_00105, partial [Dysgonamonadaceae bacterium]|nr:hypothetical protein [Dysgonamonadaceae bacterium]
MKRKPLFFLLSLLLTGTIMNLHAQQVAWTANTPPTMTPASITVLSDIGVIDVDFSPLSAAINNAKVEVQLPPNVAYQETVTADGNATGTVTATPEGTVSAGIKVSITFAGGTLNVNTRAHLQVKVIANTCAFTSGTATVKILSGTTPVSGGEQSLTVAAHKPTIRMVAQTPTTVNLTTPGGGTEKATFTYNIDVSNGSARSLKIAFSGDQYTFLENFKLDDLTVTAVPSGPNPKTWTFMLTDETFNASARQLTFDAYSSMNGQRSITATFQYPSASNCVSGTGTTLNLVYPTITENPVITFLSVDWAMNTNPVTAAIASPYNMPMDGQTPAYLRVKYKNTGKASVINPYLNFIAYRDVSFLHNVAYIDLLNLCYSINSNPLKSFNSTSVTETLSSDSYRRIKSDYIGKPKNIYAYTSDEMKPDDILTVYCPVIQGDIFDNTGYAGNIINTQTSNIQWMHYLIFGSDPNGTTIPAANRPAHNQSFSGGKDMQAPVFRTAADAAGLPPNTLGESSLSLYTGANTGSITNAQTIDIYVKLPVWMELDGVVDNTASSALRLADCTPIGYTTDDDGKTYSIRVNNSVTKTLTLKYKTVTSHNYTQNQQDNIHYWVNWNLGKAAQALLDTYRPTQERVTQVFQPVTFLVENDGVRLKSFDFYRITRGLADLDNNGIPDDGVTPVSDSYINHLQYRNGDSGEMIIKGEIAGNTFGRDFFYLTLNSAIEFSSSGMSFGNARLEIEDGETLTGTPVVYSNSQCYVKINTTALSEGNKFTLTLPFSIGTKPDFPSGTFSTSIESYLSDSDISSAADIFSPPSAVNRYGKDILAKAISIASIHLYVRYHTSYQRYSFTNHSPITITDYMRFFQYDNQLNPDVAYEYRPSIAPSEFELKVPAGYILGNDDKLTFKDSYISSNADLSLPPASKVTDASGQTTYTYNLDSIFYQGYNDQSYPPITTDQWMYARGSFSYYVDITVQATTEASAAEKEFLTNIKYKFLPTNANRNYSASSVINYIGASLDLSTTTTSINAYSKRLTLPAISIGSANAASSMNVWLYVAGNVSNLSLQKNNSSDQPVTGGSTYEGRWLSLGSLAPGDVPNYALSFDYDGVSDCSADNITVYTVSNFGEDWSPNTANAIVISDYDHNGPKKQIQILTAPASIAGSISVPEGTRWIFQTSYTLTATIDASGSQGILKNPQMTVTIPKGQHYIAGSATIEYPAGSTPQPVPSSVEEALIACNANRTVSRNFTFDLSAALDVSDFMFDGYQSNPSAAMQKATLRMDFRPECETDLNGSYITATLAGQTGCGQAVSGDNAIRTAYLPTGINYNYVYNLAVTTESGNSALGGAILTDSIQVRVEKIYGDAINYVEGKDYTEITLPQWLAVDGPVQVTSSDISSLNGSVSESDITLIATGLRIALPVSALNGASTYGRNKPFTYTIPVRYTPTSAVVSQPVQTVRADVKTVVRFGATCDEAVAPFSLQDASKKLALLTLKTPNPYLYNMVALGEECTLEITSNGFQGSWYADADLEEVVLETSPAYSFKPTVPGRNDLYVSAIFSGTNYGKIYLPVKTPPIQLYWRKAGTDANWLNPDNWELKLNENDNADGYLPALSSVVTLPSPGTETKYPVLTDTVACHIIRFEHGAELERQDLLVYDSARVQLNITANQWYMFSPPLHQMYSGDFYREDPDPYVDEQTAYTVQFNIENPETQTSTGSWNGAFNTPNVELGVGSGLAIWVDDGKDAGSHDSKTFEFPKHDTQHHLYNPDRYPPGNISKTYSIERDKNGRFIYEGEVNVNGDVTFPVSGAGSVLIGNPFMAHLNFTEFYETNQQQLDSKGYKIVHSGTDIDNFYSYAWNEGSEGKYITTDPLEEPAGESNGLIPPMQSFVVEVKNGVNNLKANIYNHTTTSIKPEDAFRSAAPDASPSSRQLNILAVRNTGAGTEVSKAIVLQGDSYATHYIPSEDSYKLFVSKVYDSDDVLKHVQLYTRSSDGYALDINFIGMSAEDITVPLCIRTSEKGEIFLNFSGMESFGESTGIYLYDAQHPERLIDL